jgi:hypothetical protein
MKMGAGKHRIDIAAPVTQLHQEGSFKTNIYVVTGGMMVLPVR